MSPKLYWKKTPQTARRLGQEEMLKEPEDILALEKQKLGVIGHNSYHKVIEVLSSGREIIRLLLCILRDLENGSMDRIGIPIQCKKKHQWHKTWGNMGGWKTPPEMFYQGQHKLFFWRIIDFGWRTALPFSTLELDK